MSDLDGNPEDQFSHNEAHLCNIFQYFNLNACKNLIYAQNIVYGYSLELPQNINWGTQKDCLYVLSKVMSKKNNVPTCKP